MCTPFRLCLDMIKAGSKESDIGLSILGPTPTDEPNFTLFVDLGRVQVTQHKKIERAIGVNDSVSLCETYANPPPPR